MPFFEILTVIIYVLNFILGSILCGVLKTIGNSICGDFECNYHILLLKKPLKLASKKAKNRFFAILTVIIRSKFLATLLNRFFGQKHV